MANKAAEEYYITHRDDTLHNRLLRNGCLQELGDGFIKLVHLNKICKYDQEKNKMFFYEINSAGQYVKVNQ